MKLLGAAPYAAAGAVLGYAAHDFFRSAGVMAEAGSSIGLGRVVEYRVSLTIMMAITAYACVVIFGSVRRPSVFVVIGLPAVTLWGAMGIAVAQIVGGPTIRVVLGAVMGCAAGLALTQAISDRSSNPSLVSPGLPPPKRRRLSTAVLGIAWCGVASVCMGLLVKSAVLIELHGYLAPASGWNLPWEAMLLAGIAGVFVSSWMTPVSWPQALSGLAVVLLGAAAAGILFGFPPLTGISSAAMQVGSTVSLAIVTAVSRRRGLQSAGTRLTGPFIEEEISIP